MKFKSKVAGYVLGIRFYRGIKNTGPHSGHLWNKGGTLLASVDFSNETNYGWQQANFSTPIAIAANTTYVISYWSPSGHWSADAEYFSASGVDSGPLHALQDGEDGNNGIFVYAKAVFPTSTSQSSNYWVALSSTL